MSFRAPASLNKNLETVPLLWSPGARQANISLRVQSKKANKEHQYWLVVLTILKHTSQWEGLSHI
jgi:hypothetical protein